MKVTVDECYELDGDYQNQFLGNEVFPQPKYTKLKCAERTVNKVHYNDVYILQPLHYYYITFIEDVKNIKNIKINKYFYQNGLILQLDYEYNKLYVFNASQNMIYLQKKTKIGEVLTHG